MTEANLQTLWPPYQSHKQMYCQRILCTIPGKIAIHLPSYAWCNLHWLQSSTRYVRNWGKAQLYTYLGIEGYLVLASSVIEFIKVCTPFLEKPSIHLYKACKSLPSHSKYNLWFYIYTILGTPSYTLLSLPKLAFGFGISCIVILHTILGKNSHTLTRAGL